MASTSINILRKKIDSFKIQESYAGLVLGAVVVIILGLLIANNFVKSRGQIGIGEQTTQQSQEEKISIAGGEYQTVAGDSLSKISQKFYGSQEFWPQLVQVNSIANPNMLWTDQTLKIPPKSEVESLRETLATTSYQVQPGDTLFTIAQKVYGDGSKWHILDRANGSRRLPNGNPLIFAGSTLLIPR